MSQVKAHFHITLGDVDSEELMKAASLIGAKCTTIDLHRDTRSQRDRMLTKYQKGASTDKVFESVATLKRNGFKVLRFKLEEMFPDFEQFLLCPFDEKNYGEVHIKTEASCPEIDTAFFRMSSNAEEVDYRFYNGRLYCEEDKKKFSAAYDMLVEKQVSVRGFHLERTVFDSHYQFDSWWA